jgi:glucose/arabinose dehydrogenase
LNVVVDPRFSSNHLLYFYYSASAEAGGTDVDRHRVVSMKLDDAGTLDLSSEQILVRGLMGPDNHNGGGLGIFGDYLFIGTGDTGNNSFSTPGDDIGNYFGSCLTNAQGKVLRVHLDGSIPDDNPLVGKTVTACPSTPGEMPSTTSAEPREEIFAWGFRNPFRLWADPKTGNVWVGNVGESTFEMVQLVPPSGGLHYGWPYREGNHGQGSDACQVTEPNVGNCTDAIYICEQSDNGGGYSTPAPNDPDVENYCDSISGGLILDGDEWPSTFQGRYVFGDFQNERVWTLPVNDARNDVIGERDDLLRTQDGGPVSFAEFDGALYVVVHAGNGHITRIAPKDSEPSTGSPSSSPQGEAGAANDEASKSSADDGGGCALGVPGARDAPFSASRGLFLLAATLGLMARRRRAV